jgi:hypothetical protein
MMNLFASFWRKRALKRYACELPGHMAKAYGARKFYTPAQIKVSIEKLKLDPAYVAHGYAACLSKETFDCLPTELRGSLPYQELRAEYLRYVPAGSFGSDDFHESGAGIQGGSDGGGSS